MTMDGRLLPLCARCTGIYSGFILGYLYQLVTLKSTKKFPTKGISMFLLMTIGLLVIDGFGERAQLWNLSNAIRLLLGLLCGSSLSLLLFPLFSFFVIKHTADSHVNAKQYAFIMTIVGLFFCIHYCSFSYYIYKIVSLAGLVCIYTAVNLTFVGIVLRINKKMKSMKRVAAVLVSVLIMLVMEVTLLHIF